MTFSVFSDEHYMKEALKEAQIAKDKDEVPIGAVVVSNRHIIAKGHNMTEQLQDVTAHAEMIALTSATEHLGSKYLNQCRVYVTIEPCAMCAGAMAWAQIEGLIFGAHDDKKGFTKYEPNLLHPNTQITSGVEEQECRSFIQSFFKEKR